MKKLLLIGIISLFSLISIGYSEEIFTCEWKFNGNTCDKSYQNVFYASDFYTNANQGDSLGVVISSPVANQSSDHYPTALCCDSYYNNEDENDFLEFYWNSNDHTCGGASTNDQPLFHVTGNENGRLAINDEYNPDHHEHTICADLPTSLSNARIIVDEDDSLEDRGYECMFRVSNSTSGVVADCDSQVAGGDSTYQYSVWGRVFETISSLSCTSECTSSVDDRVREACSNQVTACEGVPQECDGSLYGAWVSYNDTHQIQCSHSWDQYRLDPEVEGNVDIQGDPDTCPNLIPQNYNVMLDGEQTTMQVYVCSD